MSYKQTSKEHFVDWFNNTMEEELEISESMGIKRYVDFSITDDTMFSYYCCNVQLIDIVPDDDTLIWCEYHDTSFGIKQDEQLSYYIDYEDCSFTIELSNARTFEGEFTSRH